LKAATLAVYKQQDNNKETLLCTKEIDLSAFITKTPKENSIRFTEKDQPIGNIKLECQVFPMQRQVDIDMID
jgi:hypothetical protein